MWRHIRELVRPYHGWLILIFLAMLAETAASLAAPWPLKIIIDSVAGHHKPSLWLNYFMHPMLKSGWRMQIAAFAALATLLFALLGAVASYVDNYFTESVGQWVAHDLRMRIYHHLHRLSLGYYNTHQTGSLLSTITTDIQTVQGFASSSGLDILIDLLTVLSMLCFMFWLNWDFTLIALGVTPFLLLFVARFKKAVKNATREVRREQSEIVSVVQQGLESMEVIQAFGRQDLQQQQLNEVSHATVEAALRARRIKSLLSPIVTMTVAACTSIVLWRGSWLILHDKMTVGELTVFLAYLSKFFKPIKDLATMTNQIAQAAVGMERIHAILDTETVIEEKPDAVGPGPLTGEIEFRNVDFGYDSNAPVLRNLSFEVKAGQFIGIVGPTGAGKSTILSLIPRFYDPLAGEVRVDGKNLRDLKLKDLRDQIGYVLQDTVLFRGTIGENIAFGRPDAKKEEIILAAKLANAHEFIEKLPNGYNTMVGERGSTLSGGQRQRIGIARVMVRKNPILLLDEPTAALDTESEQLVVNALERLMKGKTVITIAHRLSTIRYADRILVIHDGHVAESGTHEELLSLNGVYAGLYRAQFKEDVKPTADGLAQSMALAAPEFS